MRPFVLGRARQARVAFGAVTRADRIQSYLRTTAHGFYEAVPVPPFTAFFNPRDPLRYLNYAIPDEPAEGDLSAPLEVLRETFRSRERLPRFEYVEGFAPGLAASLEAAGFELELRAPLMTCPAGEVAEPPAVPGLTVVPAVDDPRATITVGSRAFGAGDEPRPPTRTSSAWLVRRRLADRRSSACSTASPWRSPRRRRPSTGCRRSRASGCSSTPAGEGSAPR